MAASERPLDPLLALSQRRGVRQFVKFCIVGASSTLIDFAVFFLLIEVLHLQQYVAGVELGHLSSLDAARALAVVCAFALAVTNGFIWNSRWTFRQDGREGRKARYLKFVATNLIGLALNVFITVSMARIAPAVVVQALSHFAHKDPAAFFGKAIATTIVVFWNFAASKYWTFKS